MFFFLVVLHKKMAKLLFIKKNILTSIRWGKTEISDEKSLWTRPFRKNYKKTVFALTCFRQTELENDHLS